MTPLIRFGLAWMIGIGLAHRLNLPWPVVAIVTLPALSALFLYRHNPRWQSWAVLGLALTAGAFRLAFFQPVFNEGHIAFYNDRPTPVKITGLVVDEPDIRDHSINLRVWEALRATISNCRNYYLYLIW